jgi:ATP-dependent protease ClpP protease subunit
VGSLRALLTLVAAIGGFAFAGGAVAQPSPRVLAVEFENDVNPVSADYLVEQLGRAADDGFSAVVILLDTPGGLAESMNEIVEAELASPIPVVVYVSPDGARAASAGVWIGQAADVLAMAPQTNIGSSTPIALGGGDIENDDLRRKVVNDAAADLRALTVEHGRNGEWADKAVREASNLTAREALAQNVIDVIAPDLPALLNQIDGLRTVPKGFVLDTANAEVTTAEMSLWQRILDTIVDPNIIVLLMSLGVLAITVEIFNPGLIFPAAFGAISLIIGLFGLQVLPFSWAGVLLLLVAFGLASRGTQIAKRPWVRVGRNEAARSAPVLDIRVAAPFPDPLLHVLDHQVEFLSRKHRRQFVHCDAAITRETHLSLRRLAEPAISKPGVSLAPSLGRPTLVATRSMYSNISSPSRVSSRILRTSTLGGAAIEAGDRRVAGRVRSSYKGVMLSFKVVAGAEAANLSAARPTWSPMRLAWEASRHSWNGRAASPARQLWGRDPGCR